MPCPSLQVAVLAAALAPQALWAGSAAGTGSASTQVRIHVSVAPMARVMENRFPPTLDPSSHGTQTAPQRLVVSTNLHQGFCLTLRADPATVQGWRVRSVGGDPVLVEPVGDGWRVCGHRMGLHTLMLEHEFDAPGGQVWPVRTELAVL